MDDAPKRDFSYFLGGIRPVTTESSALVSSSKYLNEPAIRDWLALHFLRRNGPDLPTPGDTANGSWSRRWPHPATMLALDRLIAGGKGEEPLSSGVPRGLEREAALPGCTPSQTSPNTRRTASAASTTAMWWTTISS